MCSTEKLRENPTTQIQSKHDVVQFNMRAFITTLLIALLIISSIMAEEHEWAVELAPSANANDIANRHGFDNLGNVGNLPNHYLFRLKPQHAATREVAEERGTKLASTEGVVWSEKQVKRQMHKKPTPVPAFAQI